MKTILECSSLTKNYGSFTALNNVNLKLSKGKIIGLLGPNGSGKTTFIKIVASLLQPTSGVVTVGGNEIGIESKKIVSYLPERTYLSDWMTVEDAINCHADFYSDFNRQKADKMLSSLNIDIKARLKSLSKGTKEKVQLILVMSRDAQLYLLDEPIAGVDPAARDYILQTIISNYNPDATIILSTHLIYDIENYLDEFIFIQNGNILRYDSVDNAREKSGKSINDLFREVFRC